MNLLAAEAIAWTGTITSAVSFVLAISGYLTPAIVILLLSSILIAYAASVLS